MPEAIAEAPAAATATQVSAPAASTSTTPEAPSGIKAAMKDFVEQTTPKAPAKPAADPANPKDPAADPAKAGQPAKAEDIWAKAPEKLKNDHFKLRRESDEFKKTHEQKVSDYEKRIKEIESKGGDPKLAERYQKQVDELEKQIAASDYTKSAEFKRDFSDRYKAEYAIAKGEVEALMVQMKDGEGNVTQRKATENDLKRIMALPPGDQDTAIQEMFGLSGTRVFARLMRLQDIEQRADQAIQEHSANAAKTAEERKMSESREQQEYESDHARSIKELEEAFPDLFGMDEKDPEKSTALQTGYKFVDDLLAAAKSGKLSRADRAAYNAVIRARAAGFQSQTLVANRYKQENETLRAELSKYRKGDPGRGGEAVPTGDAPTEDGDIPQGIKAAAAMAMK